MKVPQHVIDEATRRGIVEGAIVHVIGTEETQATVLPINDWELTASGHNLSACRDAQGFMWNVMQGGSWSLVITPAPSQGLEEGMATECSPAMRAAIIERAKELGIFRDDYKSNPSAIRILYFNDGIVRTGAGDANYNNKPLTPLDFLTRLEATAKKPKPLKIGEHVVDFIANGDVKVGCTRVDYATLREVYERATKNTNQ